MKKVKMIILAALSVSALTGIQAQTYMMQAGFWITT
jgi:hypothetical protein